MGHKSYLGTRPAPRSRRQRHREQLLVVVAPRYDAAHGSTADVAMAGDTLRVGGRGRLRARARCALCLQASVHGQHGPTVMGVELDDALLIAAELAMLVGLTWMVRISRRGPEDGRPSIWQY